MSDAKKDAEIEVLNAAVHVLTNTISELVGECLDPEGNIKAPSKRGIAVARAALPRGYKHSFVQEV